uniref:Mitochondrial carrier 1 n=1 Tax=Anas platyrhynchos platyrhynchos TaxID=8840 RepID=A0A493TKL2_ANAPP
MAGVPDVPSVSPQPKVGPGGAFPCRHGALSAGARSSDSAPNVGAQTLPAAAAAPGVVVACHGAGYSPQVGCIPADSSLVFSYPARHIVKVDGKRGLFRGLTPRLISSTLSTVTRGNVKKAFPLEDMEHVSNKDDMKTSLRKVVKETSHEMMMQCVSRVVSHPLHGEAPKAALGPFCTSCPYFCHCSGVVPHIVGDVIFLWCCNLLAHFINTYAVDDNFSQASVIRSYTKFVMGIAMSMLTYPFLLVGDLMAVNNCGLRAGLPPYAPVFTSWIHCWRYLSAQVREWSTHKALDFLCSFPRALALPNEYLCCTLYVLGNYLRPSSYGSGTRRDKKQPHYKEQCSS